MTARGDLADALGEVILASRLDDADADSELALVRRTAAADSIVADLLRQSVVAARSAGQSWAAIGSELGMSRQAVQQRFGAREDRDDPLGDEERWLGPVTVFDELSELELAGQLGWHTVGAGILRHRMVRTHTQWEHRRVAWVRWPRHYEADGWQIGCKAFPWIYLIRDTGLPVT